VSDSQTRPRKLVAYFDLQDACKGEGCPVCFLVAKISLRSLDNLMWERVNDPSTREELVTSRGFCNWHAWMILQVPHSQSGTAILHEHLVRDHTETLKRLRRTRHPIRPWKRLLGRLFSPVAAPTAASGRRGKAPCPICTHVRSFEATYLWTCLECMTDLDFQRSFEGSFGLCVPHLYLTVSLHPAHPNLPTLFQQQLAKMEALRADLQEFIRKQDYRFRKEPMGDEGTAWRRSIELLTGKAGVFGPDRPLAVLETSQPHQSEEGAEAGAMPPAAELQEENEQLRFENEKLRRRIDEITKLWSQESSRAASLHFQVFELSQDKQTLEFNLAGARGERRTWEAAVARLREEIATLKEEVRRLGAGPSPE
jgi:hypothetical protein